MRKVLLTKVLFISIFFIAVSFKFTQKPARIFLIGDSTMANKPLQGNPERGWGQLLPLFFDDNTQIQNYAVNGRSTKTFIDEGRWTTVLEQLKADDWVFIQFGHNDSKKDDTVRYAAAQTAYRENLIKFVNEARQRGANPVLITPVMRRNFDENAKFIDKHGEYPSVVREVAKKYKVPLIDLHQSSQKLIESMGVEDSKTMFLHYGKGFYKIFPDGKEDNTHFSEFGARHMASLVTQNIFDLNLKLKDYIRKTPFENKYAHQLPIVCEPEFRKDTFNIQQYGAKADGITLNTQAIAKAIETCNQAGGGTVLIPKGLWLTGPIAFKNNVNLHLQKGAILQFSEDFDQYPLIQTNWEGVDAIRCHSPLYGVDLVNIAITGEGMIDGAGDAWRAVKKSKLSEPQWKKLLAKGGVLNETQDTWYPSEKSLAGSKAKRPGVISEGYTLQTAVAIKDFLRPNMLNFVRCKRVLLEGFTIQNSPAWTIHPLLCENITLKNVTARNPWYAQNGDGVDLESCRNIVMDNCVFDVGDDGICIKSGRDEEGRKRGVPTENALITNCTVYHAHGGFVIGSEMSGGARNLFISDCNFMGTDIGLRFKTTRGRGGIVEQIYVSNINMTDIVGEAILFDMYYMGKDPVPTFGEKVEMPSIQAEPLNEGTPQFKDFYIKNIVCKGAEKGIMFRGLPEMNIKNILIENAVLQANQGLLCIEADNIRLKNITLWSENKAVISIMDSKNIILDNIQYKENSELLMQVNGERSKNIRLLNTDVSKAKKDIEISEKLPKSVVVKQ
jgi:DNA sulfur modification protein DndE